MSIRQMARDVRPFAVGPVRFANPLVLAPLSGITGLPFRRVAKEHGAGMVVSELVSSNGLVVAQARTLRYLLTHPDEQPAVMQIFGDDPGHMARAAAIAQESGAPVIDLNIGCPVRKVVKRGAGCALMRDLPRSARLIRAVVRAVDVPVTIKIRAGWSPAEVNAPAYAAMAEAEGVRAVTVHGRTREQMFTGRADRDVIRRTVEAVSIPVIGNGDVDGPESAAAMLDETGCAAVMIGRAAQGNPWIFQNILETWATGVRPAPPTLDERLAVIRRHLRLHVDHAGPGSAVREMRKHVCWYTKGLPEGARFRAEVNAVTTLAGLEDALARYFEALDGKGAEPRAALVAG